jgi:flavodoxin I
MYSISRREDTEAFFHFQERRIKIKSLTMMMMMNKIAFVAAVAVLATLDVSSAWTNHAPFGIRSNPGGIRSVSMNTRTASSLDMAAVGIFFGTSTGSTQEVADFIYEALGSDIAAEPEDIETLEDVAAAFSAHDALIVGTPTWNTGADSQRSGTGWDELYYDKLPTLKEALTGKSVAVFGLGDQESYAENYADATGELFDVFEGLGCNMLGSWSQEGYEHTASKSIRGDKFCGLLLDQVNQEELSEERVQQWVGQLKDEGLLKGGGAVSAAPASAPAPTVVEATPVVAAQTVNGDHSAADRLAQLEKENLEMKQMLEASSTASHSNGDFTPHYNAKTGKTMYTSPDGRKAYVE